MKKIVYKENGTIKIIAPTKEALDILNIEQIAEKMLPTTDYKIVEDTEADIISTEINTKAQELSELEAEIKEIETHIRHAMLIDNTQVLPDLREEYKELLKRKEELTNEN